MRNNTCIQCQTEFKPRKGKLYCSNACKQQAFSDKKNEIIELPLDNQKQKEAIKIHKLYFKEYQEYRSKYPDDVVDGDFILYGFLRKNLRNVTSIDQVHEYISSLGQYWWDQFWENENCAARKKMKEFQEQYFGDGVVVDFGDS